MSPRQKIGESPPETKNNRSVGSAAAVESGIFLRVQRDFSNTTPQPGAKANSQALTIGANGYLDKASLRIVEKALVAQVAPLALALAELATGANSLKRIGSAFNAELYGSLNAALNRLPADVAARCPFNLDPAKVRVLRSGLLAPETKAMVDEAIFVALSPLVTSVLLVGTIRCHDDDLIVSGLRGAIRAIVRADFPFSKRQRGERR